MGSKNPENELIRKLLDDADPKNRPVDLDDLLPAEVAERLASFPSQAPERRLFDSGPLVRDQESTRLAVTLEFSELRGEVVVSSKALSDGIAIQGYRGRNLRAAVQAYRELLLDLRNQGYLSEERRPESSREIIEEIVFRLEALA